MQILKTDFRLTRRHTGLAGGILALALMLQYLPLRQYLDQINYDLLIRVAPKATLSDDFLLITIDEADIRALGGWPLSRDYYGYLLHGLTQMGAQVVGFDLLLDSATPAHPERDRHLAEFMRTAPPTVLAFAFSEMSGGVGTEPIWPYGPFRRSTAQGFSNFGGATFLRKVPVAQEYGDSLCLSMGAEMARLALGRNTTATLNRGRLQFSRDGRLLKSMKLSAGNGLYLGPVQPMSALRHWGMVEALQAVADSSGRIDLSGVKVLVAATAPGLPVIVQWQDGRSVPAGVVHLSVAAQMLEGGWLNPPNALAAVLIFLMAIVVACLLFRFIQGWRFWAGVGAACVLSAVLGLVVLTAMHRLMPVADAWLALVLSGTVLSIMAQQRHRQHWLVESVAYQNRLETTREALALAEREMAGLKEENRSTAAVHTETLSAARAKVTELEKRLRDLEVYRAPEAVVNRSYGGLIHSSKSPLKAVLALIDTVAAGDLPVIVQGETGTGKELVARAIHRNSGRSRAPFVAVNCGALSENLLESELFGHEKGAFTGAQARRKGRFELADGGTLFLDEITETAPAFQARLLRVLQEGTFERVGGEKTQRCNVRILAASNRDLKDEVDACRFRADLFYRLNGMTLKLPPLRERSGDLPVLVAHFLEKHASATKIRVSDAAMAIMAGYGWPGNIRELENTVRRAAMLAVGQNRLLVQVEDLGLDLSTAPQPLAASFQTLDQQVLAALRQFAFSRSAITQTAKLLGDRDRGTITEYFRGLCFEALVAHDFDRTAAASFLADTEATEVIDRVLAKLDSYLENIKKAMAGLDDALPLKKQMATAFKGLPKAYHPALEQVMTHLNGEGAV